jgi:transposase
MESKNNLSQEELLSIISELTGKVQSLETEKSSLLERNRLLENTILLFKMKTFGKKSEKISTDQLYLFNEAEKYFEPENQEENDNDTETKPSNSRPNKKPRGKRCPLPESFERIVVIHDIKEDERKCPIHNEGLVKIGEEISEQLEVIPAQVKVIRHVRYKYASPCCEKTESSIITASMPNQIIPKSNAGPGLLAHLIVGKFEDHLPLFRQENIINRLGLELSRGTTSRWMIKVADQLRPLYNLLKDDLLSHDYLHCDETTVQVLKEPDRKPENKSYMWVITKGAAPDGKQIVWHYYEQSRSGQVVLDLLDDFTGYLQTDGYKGYNIVNKFKKEITHLACWAHVRRYFHEALLSIPEKKRRPDHVASIGLGFIRKLYKIESEIEQSSSFDRSIARLTKTKVVMDEMKKWMDKEITLVLPSSPSGKALEYTMNLWPKLIIPCTNEKLCLDNNSIENKIRPFVIGRKNWLFCDTQKGADASSILFTLIETCKANKLLPYDYIRNLMVEIPLCSSQKDFEKLLPYNIL